MRSMYLLMHHQTTTTSTTDRDPVIEPRLVEIRPGAFARWIAEVEERTARGEFATNEGIAAARPDGLPEPA